MGRHGADREEQRIARQERGDDQPRFGEDDREQDDVEPGPQRLAYCIESSVEVQLMTD